MIMSEERGRIELLVTGLEQAYRRKSWHGTTFRGGLSRVDATMAVWRPGPDRPNIWEIAVHAAYWKHNVWRRVGKGDTPDFPLSGSDWFDRPAGEVTERRWKADLALLKQMHEGLVDAVSELVDADLSRVPGRGTTSVEDLVRGAAYHDAHHGGQVQLLKRLHALH